MALKLQIGFGEERGGGGGLNALWGQWWHQSQQTTPPLSNEHESWSISQPKSLRADCDRDTAEDGRLSYLTWDRLSCSQGRSRASSRRKRQRAMCPSAKINITQCDGTSRVSSNVLIWSRNDLLLFAFVASTVLSTSGAEMRRNYQEKFEKIMLHDWNTKDVPPLNIRATKKVTASSASTRGGRSIWHFLYNKTRTPGRKSSWDKFIGLELKSNFDNSYWDSFWKQGWHHVTRRDTRGYHHSDGVKCDFSVSGQTPSVKSCFIRKG